MVEIRWWVGASASSIEVAMFRLGEAHTAPYVDAFVG